MSEFRAAVGHVCTIADAQVGRLHRDSARAFRRDGVAVTASLGRAYTNQAAALQKLGAPIALRGAMARDIAGMKRAGQAYEQLSERLGKLPYQRRAIAVDDRVSIHAVDKSWEPFYTDWYGAHDLPINCWDVTGF